MGNNNTCIRIIILCPRNPLLTHSWLWCKIPQQRTDIVVDPKYKAINVACSRDDKASDGGTEWCHTAFLLILLPPVDGGGGRR